MKLLISISLFVFFGCAGSKQNQVLQTISYEELLKGSHGGVSDTKYMVIENANDLKLIYTQINKTRKPGFIIPKINFKEEQVIALFMGEKYSGGYSITVDKIMATEKVLSVFVRENKPDGMASSVITQPFYFCKISKTEKEIRFENVE